MIYLDSTHGTRRTPGSRAEGAVITLYGFVLTSVELKAEVGTIHPGKTTQRRPLAWHAYDWDPWFLVWGNLVITALLLTRSAVGPPNPMEPKLTPKCSPQMDGKPPVQCPKVPGSHENPTDSEFRLTGRFPARQGCGRIRPGRCLNRKNPIGPFRPTGLT
jgi:hypothetical protein